MAPKVGRTAGWSRLMAMKDVGVGIIGAGRIGIVHLEALAGW
jgi:phosphoglycerate dehydrogenase-like enzyme